MGSLHDVQVVADPSQLPHDASHSTHCPFEANVPAGHVDRHRPSLRNAPSQQAVQTTEEKLLELGVGRLAEVQKRRAASQRPLAVLKRKSPETAVPAELVGFVQTPVDESTLTQALVELFPAEPTTKSPLPPLHFVHPDGPADEQVSQAGSHGAQVVLLALKKPGEQAEMEVVEPARVKGAGSQAVESAFET